MLQFNFQMYFIIVLFILFQGKLCFPQEHLLRNQADFSVQKCVRSTCTCEDFVKIFGATCNKGSDRINTLWLKRPHNNSIYQLNFAFSDYLPAGIFHGLAIRDLTVDNPNATINESIFDGMDILKKFIVKRSNLQIIPDFSFVKNSIQNISIENSGLTRLEGGNLQNLPNVLYLSFSYNSIDFIHPDVFKGTENIKYLYLDHNQLKFIPQYLLKPMKNLIMFQAQSNNLSHVNNLFSVKRPEHFAKNEFDRLNQLRELNLQFNHLKSSIQQVWKLPRMEILYYENSQGEDKRHHRTTRNIRDNTSKCRCENRQRTSSDIIIEHHVPCSKFLPENRHIKPNCPERCECKCVDYKGAYFIAVDCSSRNLDKVPQISETITYYQGEFIIEDKVMGINLENNKLDSLYGVNFPSNLIQLRVANNWLKRFPEIIMEEQRSLEQVTLSRNPWICDCGGSDFKNWIHSAFVIDLGNICCGISENGDTNLNKKALWNLTDEDICPRPNRNEIPLHYIVIFVLLMLVMMSLIGQIVYNKYVLRYRLHRHLYNRRPIPDVTEPPKKWEKKPKTDE